MIPGRLCFPHKSHNRVSGEIFQLIEVCGSAIDPYKIWNRIPFVFTFLAYFEVSKTSSDAMCESNRSGRLKGVLCEPSTNRLLITTQVMLAVYTAWVFRCFSDADG